MDLTIHPVRFYDFFLSELIRFVFFFSAPNAYGLPGMLGKTVQSMKKQAPMFTITGRSKHGGFDEDLQRTPGPGKYLISSCQTNNYYLI